MCNGNYNLQIYSNAPVSTSHLSKCNSIIIYVVYICIYICICHAWPWIYIYITTCFDILHSPLLFITVNIKFAWFKVKWTCVLPSLYEFDDFHLLPVSVRGEGWLGFWGTCSIWTKMCICVKLIDHVYIHTCNHAFILYRMAIIDFLKGCGHPWGINV